MNTRIEKDREYKDRKVMNTRKEKVENTRIEKDREYKDRKG